MIDWSACPAVERSADTLSGAWRFKNTRVPVKASIENLESGATVDQFLEWFPGVKREQALAVLECAERVWQQPSVVRVLFDQGTPVPLRNYLPEHKVATAAEMVWSTLSNGELLDAAEREFDLLVTTDQALRTEQNLSKRRIAILVLPLQAGRGWNRTQK